MKINDIVSGLLAALLISTVNGACVDPRTGLALGLNDNTIFDFDGNTCGTNGVAKVFFRVANLGIDTMVVRLSVLADGVEMYTTGLTVPELAGDGDTIEILKYSPTTSWTISVTCEVADCSGHFAAAVVGCDCPSGQSVDTVCSIDAPSGPQDAVCIDNTSAPTSAPISGGGGGGGGIPCFSGETLVQVEGHGDMAVKDLSMGTKVLTRNGNYQPVYAWAHFDRHIPAKYLKISTSGGVLEISEEHMLFMEGKAGPIRADLVKVGDVLVGDSQPLKITKIKRVNRYGAYAPLTPDGTVVVGGVVASNYIAVLGKTSEFVEVGGERTEETWRLPLTHGTLAHAYASPLRLACMGVSSSICDWQNEEGIHVYLAAGHHLVNMMGSWSIMLQLLIVIVAMLTMAPFMLIESTFGVTNLGPLVLLIGYLVVVFSKKDAVGLLARCPDGDVTKKRA